MKNSAREEMRTQQEGRAERDVRDAIFDIRYVLDQVEGKLKRGKVVPVGRLNALGILREAVGRYNGVKYVLDLERAYDEAGGEGEG